VGSQVAQIIKHFLPEPIGSPLVRVLFTNGMIAGDFWANPTGYRIGHAHSAQLDHRAGHGNFDLDRP
jgi:hypothetical protein